MAAAEEAATAAEAASWDAVCGCGGREPVGAGTVGPSVGEDLQEQLLLGAAGAAQGTEQHLRKGSCSGCCGWKDTQEVMG